VVDLPGSISLAELEQQALAAFEKLGFVASSPATQPHPDVTGTTGAPLNSRDLNSRDSRPDSSITAAPSAAIKGLAKRQNTERQNIERQNTERQNIERQNIERQNTEPQNTEPQHKQQPSVQRPNSRLMQAEINAEINKNPLLQALQAQNQDLQRRVSQLEEVLNDCRDTLQLQMMRSQTQETLLTQQTDELTSARSQLGDLLGELATSQEAVEKQKILIETLTQQLEGSQERVAHLERVCALAQQRHVEQVNHLQQSEQPCRELRSRLHRQQRQTLQFRTALEQCLELPRNSYPHNGAYSPSHIAPHANPATPTNQLGLDHDELNPNEQNGMGQVVGPVGEHQSEGFGGSGTQRSAIQPWSAHQHTAGDTPHNLLDLQDEAALEAPIMPKRGTQLPADLRPSELAALAAWELEADQPTPEAIASAQEYSTQEYSTQEYSAQEYSAQEYSAQEYCETPEYGAQYGPEFDEDAMLPEQFAPGDWPDAAWAEAAELAIADQSAIAPGIPTPLDPHNPTPQLDAAILDPATMDPTSTRPMNVDAASMDAVNTDSVPPNSVQPNSINADHASTDNLNADHTHTANETDDGSAHQPHPSLAKVLEMGAALLRQSQDRRSSASVVALESLDERAHADAVAFAALDLPEAFGSELHHAEHMTAEHIPAEHIPAEHIPAERIPFEAMEQGAMEQGAMEQGAIANPLSLPQFERSAIPSGAKVIPLNTGHAPEAATRESANRHLTPPLLQAKSPTSKRRTTLAAVELPRFNRRSS
jgi:hypothetical protein